MTEREYVIMFDDGSLMVETLLVLCFMNEAGIKFEVLGYL